MAAIHQTCGNCAQFRFHNFNKIFQHLHHGFPLTLHVAFVFMSTNTFYLIYHIWKYILWKIAPPPGGGPCFTDALLYNNYEDIYEIASCT